MLPKRGRRTYFRRPTPHVDVSLTHALLQADDHVIGALLGLLGVVVDAVDVVLGLQCSPIKIVGLGTDKACSSNVVCCENNSIVSPRPSLSPRSGGGEHTMLTVFCLFRRAASSPSAAFLSFSNLSPPMRLDVTSYLTSRSLLLNM